MNRRLILFGIVLISIISLVINQQLRFFEFSRLLFGKNITPQSRPFTVNEGKLNVVVDIEEVGGDFLRFEGWAIMEGQSKKRSFYLYLRNSTDSILISTIPVERPDVSEFLKSELYRYAGYKIFFPVCEIPPGTYQIGFMAESNDALQGKLLDKNITIAHPPGADRNCDSIKSLGIDDHISLQRFNFRKLRPYLAKHHVVGFISDTLPFPFNDIRVGEVMYSMAPLLVKRSLSYDTIIAHFPTTLSIENPENRLYARKDDFEVLRDFGNGIFVLRKIKH